MLHHLPRKGRAECAREMRRLLKPVGHVLAVDFAGPEGERKGFLGHRHGHVTLRDVIAMLTGCRLETCRKRRGRIRNLQFTLAKAP